MAETLLIRIAPPDESIECCWRMADAAAERGTLADAARLAPGRRIVLLIPGSEVLLTTVQVPAKSRAKAQAAIPWVLEDRLVAEVEDLQFALGESAGEGVWRVAVIARERLDARLAACREAGLEPAVVVPEPLALARSSEGAWTALEEPQRVTVRTGAEAGFACEPELVGLIATTLEPPERIERHRVAGADPHDAWPESLDEAIGASGNAIDHHDAMTAFDAGTAVGALNLLQGEYSRSERTGRSLRRWRVPAAMAAALLAVVLVEGVLGHLALGGREAALRGQIEQVFRDTFPEVDRVVNPRAQMETRIAQLRGGAENGFADRLAQAGEILTAQDGASLTAVTWREGVLELELDVNGLQVLDAVQRGMQEAGLQAEITGADSSGENVAGRIRLAAAQN